MQFETKAIHAGQQSDPSTGAVIVPVFQTSTYQQEAIGKHKGYEYSRTGNPTRTALETCLAELEGGRYGLAFSSGMAATTAVFSMFGKGAHIVLGDDLYGGTYRLMEKVFGKWGISATYADVDDPESFERSITAQTRLIWIESPTNPLLKVIDIQRLAGIAQAAKVLLAVDNTFASPYFQNPLALGADIVVHSTTKYINGHSDVVGGALVVNDEALYGNLKFHQNAAGAVPGPWDCWLTLRGLKTLAVRMREHEKNAKYLAEFLSRHEKVVRTYYPGLAGTSDYDIASKQMRGFGGMLSFEIKGGAAAVEKFLSGLKIFVLAESLGGVESLVSCPAKMTHASMPEAERLKRGIKDTLIRLSVGIEHREDLKADLENALRGICNEALPAGNIKGRKPVQLAAFWLEALWMALSLPAAKAPGQPSQKERRYFGMQAGSKGRVCQGIGYRYVSRETTQGLSPFFYALGLSIDQPSRPFQQSNTPFLRSLRDLLYGTCPQVTSAENPELCNIIEGFRWRRPPLSRPWFSCTSAAGTRGVAPPKQSRDVDSDIGQRQAPIPRGAGGAALFRAPERTGVKVLSIQDLRPRAGPGPRASGPATPRPDGGEPSHGGSAPTASAARDLPLDGRRE